MVERYNKTKHPDNQKLGRGAKIGPMDTADVFLTQLPVFLIKELCYNLALECQGRNYQAGIKSSTRRLDKRLDTGFF